MSKFFALLNRMKYINRWSLMRNMRYENIAEHSHQVSIIAHTLAIIDNRVFGNSLNADRVGMLAVYHESSEVLTGDLPTPVKYYNEDMISAYKAIEKKSEEHLLKMLPSDIERDVRSLVQPNADSYEYRLVKYADKLAAYIKCVEEIESGNVDFAEARDIILSNLQKTDSKCLKYFMDNFLEGYFSTLDSIGRSF